MRFKPRSTPTRKSARRSPTGAPPRKSGFRPRGCGIRAFRSRARPACAACATRPAASIGIADETLWPIEGDLIVDQLLFDSGGREAEIRRQAARTDAAAARVEERSRVRRAQRRRGPTSTICSSSGWWRSRRTMRPSTSGSPATFAKASSKGSISIADQQQAEERLQSARARVTEAREDLETAGDHLPDADRPADRQRVDAARPVAVHAGDARGRRGSWPGSNNPRVQEAIADLATAREEIRAARPNSGRAFNLEGRARAGHDIDGFAGPHDRPAGAAACCAGTSTTAASRKPTSASSRRRADEVHAPAVRA